MSKKENIKRAAHRLFADYGYDGASIADIANEAGIKKANVYFYYPKKEELLFQLIEEEMENYSKYILSMIEIDTNENVERTLFNLFENKVKYFCSNKYRAKFVCHFIFIPYKSIKNKVTYELKDFGVYNKLYDPIYNLFKKCSNNNLIEISPKEAVKLYYWFSNVFIFHCMEEEMCIIDEIELQKIWRFFWKGIKV